MSTEETLLSIDFDKASQARADDGVLSLSSSAEEICLVPEIGFEGAVDSPGLNRESQPLLGGRGDYEESFNNFPGTYVCVLYDSLLLTNFRKDNVSSIWYLICS